MLIEFKARNFRSFWDEFTFSMLATADKSLPANTFPAPRFGGRKVLHSAAIYGANASGKSNLVAAVQFVVRFISQSAEQATTNQIDAAPFLLAAGSREQVCQSYEKMLAKFLNISDNKHSVLII